LCDAFWAAYEQAVAAGFRPGQPVDLVIEYLDGEEAAIGSPDRSAAAG
jgi:hypothetical protein